MEKVILITSREFIGTTNTPGFKELNNYLFVKEEEIDPVFGTKKTELKGYLGMFFRRPWGAIGDEATMDKDTAITAIKNFGIKNWKTRALFKFGVWKKDLDSTLRIYMADEFPFYNIGFSHDKQYYLNALLEELKNDVGNDNLEKIREWEICSHDLDWGEDALSKELNIGSFVDKVSDANTTLLEFLKKDNLKVFVFQHFKTSGKYLELQKLLSNNKQ